MSHCRNPTVPLLGRRTFLTSFAAAGGASMSGISWRPAHAAGPMLKVGNRTIEVSGKPAKVFHIEGPGGTNGV
jgi:hypothetical protein